jgi:hypothetical protein
MLNSRSFKLKFDGFNTLFIFQGSVHSCEWMLIITRIHDRVKLLTAKKSMKYNSNFLAISTFHSIHPDTE